MHFIHSDDAEISHTSMQIYEYLIEIAGWTYARNMEMKFSAHPVNDYMYFLLRWIFIVVDKKNKRKFPVSIRHFFFRYPEKKRI